MKENWDAEEIIKVDFTQKTEKSFDSDSGISTPGNGNKSKDKFNLQDSSKFNLNKE